MVSVLMFGFWNMLFEDNYKNLWNMSLCNVFNNELTRKEVHKKITIIRELRNRIAHHHCILHLKYKPQEYKEQILMLINLIVGNKEIVDYIEKQCQIPLIE